MNFFRRSQEYFGKSNLNILRHSKILIIGTGSIGNEVIKNLIQNNIKQLFIIDPDKVSQDNLNRCILFSKKDISIPKVQAAINSVKQKGFDCDIKGYDKDIEDFDINTIPDFDIILSCVDNDYARYIINMKWKSLERPVPLIDGSMASDFIDVRLLHNKKGPCLVCSWADEYKKNILETTVKYQCQDFINDTIFSFPSVSFLNSMVGALMALECTRVLLTLKNACQNSSLIALDKGLGYGEYLRFRIDTLTSTRGKIQRNPKCCEPFCRYDK